MRIADIDIISFIASFKTIREESLGIVGKLDEVVISTERR
jgi:hypothetical protein